MNDIIFDAKSKNYYINKVKELCDIFKISQDICNNTIELIIQLKYYPDDIYGENNILIQFDTYNKIFIGIIVDKDSYDLYLSMHNFSVKYYNISIPEILNIIERYKNMIFENQKEDKI